MGWAKVVEYFMKFVAWAWENKWTMLFIVFTVVALSMYGCEKSKLKTMTENWETCKKDLATCSGNYTSVMEINKSNDIAIEACEKELQITKDSYVKAGEIITKYEAEVKKYKALAKQIDAEKDPVKQLELKKRFFEDLFKGVPMMEIKAKFLKVK